MRKIALTCIAIVLFLIVSLLSIVVGHSIGMADEFAQNLLGRLALYLQVDKMCKYIYSSEKEQKEIPCGESDGTMYAFCLLLKYYNSMALYDWRGEFDGRFRQAEEEAMQLFKDLDLALIPANSGQDGLVEDFDLIGRLSCITNKDASSSATMNAADFFSGP